MADSPNAPRQDASDDLAILQQILALHGGQLDNFHPAPGTRPRPPPQARTVDTCGKT